MERLCGKSLPLAVVFLPHLLQGRGREAGRSAGYLCRVGRMPPELGVDSEMLGIPPSVLGRGEQRQPHGLSDKNDTQAVDLGKDQGP